MSEHGRTATGDDSGQAGVAAVLVAVVGLLLVITVVLLPIADGADLDARTQNAADAAALAGADGITEQVFDGLGSRLALRGDPRDLIGGGLPGLTAAEANAAQNGVRVTDYAFSGLEVQVAVESVETLDSEPRRLEREAGARLGFDLSACRWVGEEPEPELEPEPSPEPTAVPTAEPTPTPTPEPPADWDVDLVCPGLSATFRVDGETRALTLRTRPEPPEPLLVD